jgi:RNA-binding protein
LRARAHSLNPVVSIAENGLTESVLKEIETNLKAHELIKIRVYGDSRENRIAYLEQICSELDAAAGSAHRQAACRLPPGPA